MADIYYNLLFLTLLNDSSGPSPESQQSKKGEKPALSKNNPNLSISDTCNDSLDDSETLFIPHGNGQAKSQGATSAISATNKSKLGKRNVKDHILDDTDTALVASKAPPNKRAKINDLSSSTKRHTAPKLTAKGRKSTSTDSRSAPRPQSKGSLVESSGSRSGHLSTQHTSDSIVDDDDESTTTLPDELLGDKSKQINLPKTTAPKARSKANKADGVIFAGVDFGTTYSTVCWARTRKPKDIRPIQQWPTSMSDNLQGETREKVPIEIQYSDGRESKWGFQIPSDVQRHKWFKLLLDPSSNIDTGQAKNFSDRQAAPPGYDLEPEDIVADYLTALRKHFEAILKLSLPSSMVLPGVSDIDAPDCKVPAARFTLRGADLCNVFEPIIKDVIGLVEHQMKATISTDFLATPM
ncbi:MAG: hypothetical protein Q9198_000387 [Flavoplaca austrocitrina]